MAHPGFQVKTGKDGQFYFNTHTNTLKVTRQKKAAKTALQALRKTPRKQHKHKQAKEAPPILH